MAITYTEIPASELQQACIQRNNEDGSVSFIPCSQDNSDYQAYLASLQAPQANSTES
jgi:hypothetical protein